MEYRTCTKCLQEKSIEGFYFETRSNRHLARCKECVTAYMRGRRLVPSSAELDRVSGERCRKRRKLADPSRWTWASKTPLQRKQSAEAVRRWRERNAVRFGEESRRSLQLRRSLAFAKAWPVIVRHYGGRCLGCGASASLCFDHVKPLRFDGPNLITNGQPLCRKCNTFKGGTISDKDYRPDRGAWIRELGRLNPWLVEPMPEGRWHLSKDGQERRARLMEESARELVMPDEGVGQLAEGEWVPSPIEGVAPLDAGQIAQRNLLSSLLANLPR